MKSLSDKKKGKKSNTTKPVWCEKLKGLYYKKEENKKYEQ